jgi:hypothetical protein
MPLRDFDVKNVIDEVLDSIQVLIKPFLEIFKVVLPLLTTCTTEDWHLAASSPLSELQLAFTDLFQVSASLDKGFIFGKDGIVFV